MFSELNPLGPIAGAFFNDNSEVAAIMGPVGSAKTTAAGLRLMRHAYEQRPFNGVRRTRFAIVRNTGPQLIDTTIKTWLKLFPENSFGKFSTTSKTHRWHFRPQGSNDLIHAEFIFRALDDEKDIANLLSLEVTGMWFNELREINQEILAMAGRRVGRYPGADLGGCTWRGWFGDTNPWAVTSDFHDMFVASPREGYKFFKQPGGMEPDAENLENLEQTPETLEMPLKDPRRLAQGRTYYIKALRDFSKADGEMYVHCKYGASREGKPCFTSYDDNAHCQRFELPDGVPIHIGYDNTGRHPAAVIAYCDPDGQWMVRYEFCGLSIGMKEHAAALRRFLAEKFPKGCKIEKITCDPAGVAKDSGELDMRMVVAQAFPGVMVVNARTNDIETRIEAVDGVMRTMVNGAPKLLIHPDCKNLRSACISKYHYRKMKIAGEERYTETPEKTTPYADVADALEYLMLGGGEGRLSSGIGAKEVQWPKDGALITPQAPARAGAPVNPFTGRRDGWNPLGVQGY